MKNWTALAEMRCPTSSTSYIIFTQIPARPQLCDGRFEERVPLHSRKNTGLHLRSPQNECPRHGRQGAHGEIGRRGTRTGKALIGFSVRLAIRSPSSSSPMGGRITAVTVCPRLVVLLFGVRFDGPVIYDAQ